MSRYSRPLELDHSGPLRGARPSCDCTIWRCQGPHRVTAQVKVRREFAQPDASLFPCFSVAQLPAGPSLLRLGRRTTEPIGLEIALPPGTQWTRSPETAEGLPSYQLYDGPSTHGVRFAVFAGRLDPRHPRAPYQLVSHFDEGDVTQHSVKEEQRILLGLSPEVGNRRYRTFSSLVNGKHGSESVPDLLAVGAPQGGTVTSSEAPGTYEVDATLCRIHTPFLAWPSQVYLGRTQASECPNAPTSPNSEPPVFSVRELLPGSSAEATAEAVECREEVRRLVGPARWDESPAGSPARAELLSRLNDLALVLQEAVPNLFDLDDQAFYARLGGLRIAIGGPQ